MINNSVKYQTISEYIRAPFGTEDNDNRHRLETMYISAKRNISCKCVCEYEKTYMFHILIPSESQKDKTYDVIIQFFSPDKETQGEPTLSNYFIQFFSNSPSFIYRYAVLYKQNGFLIDSLQDKFNPEYANTLPEKTNKNMKMTYDKSLYFACRFLLDHSLLYLSKKSIKTIPKLDFRHFIDGIQDYTGQKIERELYEIEADFKKELKQDLLKAENVVKKRKRVFSNSHVIEKKPKITQKTSTIKSTIPKKSAVTKKVAKKRSRTSTTKNS